MFTLKMRVSRISNMRVASVTRKTPAYWVKGVLVLVVMALACAPFRVQIGGSLLERRVW
jgi:hypothetical protein